MIEPSAILHVLFSSKVPEKHEFRYQNSQFQALRNKIVYFDLIHEKEIEVR